MKMLVHNGLFYLVEKLKLFILTVPKEIVNMFIRKLKNLLDIKSWKQTYLEYNQTIQ